MIPTRYEILYSVIASPLSHSPNHQYPHFPPFPLPFVCFSLDAMLKRKEKNEGMKKKIKKEKKTEKDKKIGRKGLNDFEDGRVLESTLNYFAKFYIDLNAMPDHSDV